MITARQRPILVALAALVLIWVAAIAGYQVAQHAKVTPEKVRAYTASLDFDRLSAAERAAAIKKLAAMLNALSYEERQRLRMQHFLNAWFARMTDDEKAQFIEATMPTGIKQMINAFEQLPEDKRRQALDNAMKNLRATENGAPTGGTNAPPAGTNAPPPISPELEAKIRTIGLKAFYRESSAETKAEAAPLLEELQHVMESGRLQRPPP